MDGSYDNFRRVEEVSVPWWRQRLDAGRSLLLMGFVVGLTFGTLLALDGSGNRLSGVTTYVQGE